ncbi:predicted protein [Culex quinquefasciatus]|uniref:Predicted protein n=1 Tax=Culex quinquefasciatus TaxID=7176 RepID=B0XBP9_CULQU|nr:predicted protein [Culex quinquefasciatus]|eukprot:XP_001867071.1 predicted protein [Culex quinquefasciatus]
MEVKENQSVPISPVVPSIDDLPNEVLVMIFRLLPFADRLQVCIVCKRWNGLVFSFLDEHIFLCLSQEDRNVPEGALSEYRTYRQVKLCGSTFDGLEDVHGERIEALAAGARSLVLEIREPQKEEFIQLLRKFCHLRSLTMSCEEFYVVDEEDEGRGLLPNLERLAFEQLGDFRDSDSPDLLKLFMRNRTIRHFVIRYCDPDFHKIVEWMDLLEALAPRLLSLSLNINCFLARYPCEMKFKALKVLYLRVQFSVEGFTADELTQAVYRMANLEDLTIVFFAMVGKHPLKLDGVWQLTKLNKFIANVDSFVLPEIIQPMPHLETLSIKINDATELQKLKQLFPNLKALEIQSIAFNRELWLPLVTAWPTLENLNFRVGNQFLGVRMLKTLQSLSNLRKLALSGVYKAANLSILDPVLAIATLQELHAKGTWKGSVSGLNRFCRVFVNEKFVPRSAA